MKRLIYLALLSPLALHAMHEKLSLKIAVTKDGKTMAQTVPLQTAGIHAGNLSLRPNASFVMNNQDNSESYTYQVTAHDASDNMVDAQGVKTTPANKKFVQFWVKKLTHKDNQLKSEECSAIQGFRLSHRVPYTIVLKTLIKSEEAKSGMALLSAPSLHLTIVPSSEAKM